MRDEEIIKIANSIFNREFSKYRAMREDLVSECVLGIMEASAKYDESRGAKTTYLWTCGRNRVLQYLRRERKALNNRHEKSVEEMSEYLVEEQESEEPVAFANVMQLIEEMIDNCSGRSKGKTRAIARDFLSGMKCTAIANKYGVSRQMVSKTVINLRNEIKANYDFRDGEFVRKRAKWELESI